MITVYCVLVRPKYTVDDVIRLNESLRLHLTKPHRLICLTDWHYLEHSDIEFINITDYDLDTWWNKVLVFDSSISNDINLYFDLDTMIYKNIDLLVEQIDDKHITVVDTPWKNEQYFAQKYKGVRAYKIADALFHYGNTSVMGWKGSKQFLVDMLFEDMFTHVSQHYGDDTFINKYGNVRYFDADIQRYYLGMPSPLIAINYLP